MPHNITHYRAGYHLLNEYAYAQATTLSASGSGQLIIIYFFPAGTNRFSQELGEFFSQYRHVEK